VDPKLLFLDPDPAPTFQSITDLDPDPTSRSFRIRIRIQVRQKFRIWADPDPQHWLIGRWGGGINYIRDADGVWRKGRAVNRGQPGACRLIPTPGQFKCVCLLFRDHNMPQMSINFFRRGERLFKSERITGVYVTSMMPQTSQTRPPPPPLCRNH